MNNKKRVYQKYLQERKGCRIKTQSTLDAQRLLKDKQEIDIDSADCIIIADEFELALKVLSGETLPRAMVGREEETKTITGFLRQNLKMKITHSFPLVISGVPGVGKTMTVRSCVQKFSRTSQYPFKTIELNLMKMKSLNDTIPQIIKQLNISTRLDKSQFARLLDTVFMRGSYSQLSTENTRQILQRKVLIIDEVQFLTSQSHKQIFYCLLNWLHYPHTNMLLILISNKMDLNVYESRVGNNCLVFHPYSCKDMMRIVENMICQMRIFSEKAVEYAVKKVAVCSSDMRRLIYLLTLSIQICKTQHREGKQQCLVSLQHIQQANAKIYQNIPSKAIKKLKNAQKLLLISICSQIRFSKVCLSHMLLRKYKEFFITSESNFMDLLFSLEQIGIIKCKSKIVCHTNNLLVDLLIDKDYIIKAFQEQPWLSPFLFKLLT